MKKLKTVTAAYIKDCKISKDLETYFNDTLYQTDAYHDEYHPNIFRIHHLKSEIRILRDELKNSPLTEEERNWNQKILTQIFDLIDLLKVNKVQVVYF